MNKLLISVLTIGVVAAAGCSTGPQDNLAGTEPSTGDIQRLEPSPAAISMSRKLQLSPEQIELYRSGALTDNLAGPVMVDMADVPAATTIGDPNLVTGGAEIDSPFSAAQIEQARAAAMARGTDKGVNVLEDGSDNLGVNNNGKGKGIGKKGPKLKNVVDSIGAEDCCVDTVYSAIVPPDSEMTAGPDHLIATVNVTAEIYDKSGNVLIPAFNLGSLFDLFPGYVPFDACGPNFIFDPDIVYDEAEDRFIMGYDGGGAFYCMAVTAGSDPTGLWYLYWFDGSNGFDEFFDFPHMGVGTDAIYVGSNQFNGAINCGGFCGGAVFAVDKNDMYNFALPTVVRQNILNGPGGTPFDSTPQPANPMGAAEGTLPVAGPHYIMTEAYDGIHHTVWTWDDPFGANNLSILGIVDLATSSGVSCDGGSCYPVLVPQNDGGNLLLDGGDWRGHETKYRNGSLWTTQTVSCNPAGETVNCIRWAEIDPSSIVPAYFSTAGVVQAGVFSSDDGLHRFYPSLSVNMCGDMAIGYSTSSEDTFASVAITGRRHNDQPGRVRSEVGVMSGTEVYRSFQPDVTRWGDYSSMVTDPNGVDFFHIGEYAGESSNGSINWRNAISQSKFGCSLEDL